MLLYNHTQKAARTRANASPVGSAGFAAELDVIWIQKRVS
jgi:hypothetical protein